MTKHSTTPSPDAARSLEGANAGSAASERTGGAGSGVAVVDPPCSDAGLDGADFYDADSFDPQFDDPPPPPAWVLDAALERDRIDLMRAASEPPNIDAFKALVAADPAALDANALLDAIAATQRLANYAQAMQQRYLAAFARPGVATPLEHLVDAALHPEGRADQPFRPLADAIPDGLPVDENGEVDFTPLLAHPDWRLALEAQAARDASAEVGCLLNLAPITARSRTEKALEMVHDLPATLDAWQRGDLDSYRARIIADRTAVLGASARREVEQRVLPVAQERTGAALRRLTDREVIAADSEAAAERERAAHKRRGVTLGQDEDGMAGLHLCAAAPDAAMVHGLLDAIATAVRAAGQAEGRGASQLRADAMVDVFRSLNDTGHASIDPLTAGRRGGTCAAASPVSAPDSAARTASGAVGAAGARSGTGAAATDSNSPATSAREARTPRHHSVALNVYLDAATLAGLENNPAELDGYGAITADTARAVAESADTIRAILTRPPGPDRACGTILDAGRAVYRPPTATADYVTARDRTCRFPGCRASAIRCDLDHRTPFESERHRPVDRSDPPVPNNNLPRPSNDPACPNSDLHEGSGEPLVPNSDRSDAGTLQSLPQASGAADTCPHNLNLLCRAHHRLKTFTGWSAMYGADASAGDALIWTSPQGRRYLAESGHLLHDRGSESLAGLSDDPPPF